jgi:lipopolysaccharide biosynthesis glycosyltransferase
MNLNTINVAYSCNEAYIQHTGISLLSLLENNRIVPGLNIYFIEKDVSESSLKLLKNLAEKYSRNLTIISFYELCCDLKIRTAGRHIETVYSKLFFSRIEGIEKILYIDSDTIINSSLDGLWRIDLGNNLMAGVETYSVNYKTDLNLSRSDKFINDGVVLLNLKELRLQNTEEKFIDCIREYDGDPPVLSEGVINKVCKGKILILDPKYNLMSGLLQYKGNRFANMDTYYDLNSICDAVSQPVIIHYLSAFYNRPWNINCTHPLKGVYLDFKNRSYWKDVPFEKSKLPLRIRLIKLAYIILPHDLLDIIRFLKLKYFA